MATNYYYQGVNQGSSCKDIRKFPLIYDYGGKPNTDSGTLNFFVNSGDGTSVLGIDCSGYVFSAIGKGVPLGNITSQIFANIYLNKLDEYAKKELKCRFYIRYNDDFVILAEDRAKLEQIRNKIIFFVKERLSLNIPLEKTSIRKIDWGVDFLGFTILPKATLLRNKQKNRYL